MSNPKRNAIILAAGMSSRFVPLSVELPKGLLEVKGEILIERQIRQLQKAGVSDITIVVGYKAEKFNYLKEKFGVDIILNEDYWQYNNTSSLIRVVDRLKNTYICSSDNYFPGNVFLDKFATSFYSALYSEKETNEYCLTIDKNDNIIDVTNGGRGCWFMIGHVFFSEEFSNFFKEILRNEYTNEMTRHEYWEDVYIRFIRNLPPLKVNRYAEDSIYEFDSLDELRHFDASYITDTRSQILKDIATRLNCQESDLTGFKNIPNKDETLRFSFYLNGARYQYSGREKVIETL